jgi:hypothetical protein
LPEDLQEPFIKQAIQELTTSQTIVPHDQDVEQVQKQTATVAKRIILPN